MKLYVCFGLLFVHISGLLSSVGLASFVVQEDISLLHWIAAAASGKSIGERLGVLKVSRIYQKMTDFMLRGR